MLKPTLIIALLLALCATIARAAEPASPKAVVLFDFQRGGQNRFTGADKLEFVPEHAAPGKSCGKVSLQAAGASFEMSIDFDRGANMQGRWGEFDQFIVDVFVEGGPAKVSNFIRDPEAINWETRYNSDFVLKPGQGKLVWSLHGLMRERGGGGKPMDPSKINVFKLSFASEDKDHPTTIYLQSARLVKAADELAVPGMRKFSFGPAGSALMPGFTAVSKASQFNSAQGFGWLPGAEMAADFDISEIINRHRPADDLCRHCCMPNLATFAVALPNGSYRGWLMMAPPLYGWAKNLRHRTVKANGSVVLDQEFTAETFKTWEYAFQDAEDLPGDDLWAKYINVLFVPTLFDFTVTDGQLKVDFDAHGQAKWGAVVHALVIWPKDQDAPAAQWLTNLNTQRKDQYRTQHVEKLPPLPAGDGSSYAASTDDKARGYVRFVNHIDKTININSVPTPEEAAKASIDLSAAPNEYADACFGVYPLGGCGVLKLAVGDLTGPGGARLPAQDVQFQVVRYKSLNLGKLAQQSACYMPMPKYLDSLPAAGLPIAPGITRSFWLIAHVPKDAAAGAYKGDIALTWSNGKTDHLPVNLNVWPIKLDALSFPMGMFMTAPAGGYLGLDPTGASAAQAWKEVLEDSRAHGMTSVDPAITIPLKKYRDGKAEIDFTEGDRFMDAARAAGFNLEVCGYAINTGFRMKISPDFDPAVEAKKWGAADYGQLAKAYFDAVREHAQQKNWLPICWCTDDEYLVHPGGVPEKLAALHRTLQQSAPDFHFCTFDSTQFDKLPQQAAAFEKMLADIDTWGAGLHSVRQAELAKKVGRRLLLYNAGVTRFTFGAYMFMAHRKYDVCGFYQWIYPNTGSYGQFYLASYNEAHYGVTYPSTCGLRSTPQWERIRAGVTDHCYLETAWNLIERAKAAGKPAAAAELQALLDKMFGQITFGEKKAYEPEAPGDPDKLTTPLGLEHLRQSLAAAIIRAHAQLQ